jgi:hypothetical protein
LFLGVSPVRIDLLRRIDGVEFASAYARREAEDLGGVPVSIIGLDVSSLRKRQRVANATGET